MLDQFYFIVKPSENKYNRSRVTLTNPVLFPIPNPSYSHAHKSDILEMTNLMAYAN